MPLGSVGGILGGGGVIGRAVVELVGDSAKLRKDVTMAQGQVEKSTGAMGKTTSTFGTVAKVAMLAAGAALLRFGADALKSFREAQIVADTTAATIKATGGAANVTAEEVGALSARMMEYAVVDDEVIQQGQNILLTFKAVRNEVGAGNAIFDQATRLTLDLALALNKGSREGLDLKSTALQLGKALANPAEGLGKLMRSGVDFTDQQREQIIAMAEAGDTLGAQKAILAEVEAQVGGLARETADAVSPAQRLGLEWDEFKERIGGVIASGLDPLMENLGKLIDVAQVAGNVLGDVGEQIDKISLLQFGAEISGASSIVEDFERAAAEALRGGAISVQELEAALPGLNQQLAGIDLAGRASLGSILALAGGERQAAGSARELSGETDLLAEAHDKAANAAREQRSAELALAGGFLGVQGAALDAGDAQREYAAAQATVNRLQEQGKQGTAAYREAMRALRAAELGTIQSQLGLAEAVADYVNESAGGEGATRTAVRLVREYGRMAGLSARDVDALIGRVRDLIGAYAGVPESVHTVFHVDFPSDVEVRKGTAEGGILAGAQGFITRGPTVLVGEGRRQTFAGRGTEAVIPFDDRGIGILAKALGKAGERGGRSVSVGDVNVFVEGRGGGSMSDEELSQRIGDAVYRMILGRIPT